MLDPIRRDKPFTRPTKTYKSTISYLKINRSRYQSQSKSNANTSMWDLLVRSFLRSLCDSMIMLSRSYIFSLFFSVLSCAVGGMFCLLYHVGYRILSLSLSLLTTEDYCIMKFWYLTSSCHYITRYIIISCFFWIKKVMWMEITWAYAC